MVNFGVHHLPLPGGAPAPKNRGSLPPLPPRPVRRHDAPGEARTTQAGAALRFTAEDSGNPCQPASNADSRAQPGPQRRGLCPLIVQICSCRNRAPPACATPRSERGTPIRRHVLDPRRRKSSIILLRPRPAFPSPPSRSCPRPRRGRHGVRRCPNRHQRWLAATPPLLVWPLPGLGPSRPGERAGSGRDGAGPTHPFDPLIHSDSSCFQSMSRTV